ncbi:hypothetical protein RM844_28665 [Streptomyces sp. DSM 44915]|uniref:Minor tail protein n=1 Tax=Streptomyces chisholmiae TaxID=3075540 RepID=A0ABU2JZ21_9ACTN|nr:hypothetical protein [Streptomyces sp. DSM 44915]MDT0270250.1 hypothetical protein [Streptomyces sp. DSM 44915]
MPELRYEIWTGAGWEDITGDVRTREATVISRGRPDEATTADPGSASFQLNNGASRVNGVVGRYSPRNPRSDLYGRIGRNTPVRVSVRGGAPYLDVPESTRMDAAVSDPLPTPTTGLDVRVDLALARVPGQTPATAPAPWRADWTDVIGQYVPAGDQRSWYLTVNAFGGLSIRWSTDGTNGAGSIVTAQMSDRPVPYRSGERFALRVVATWSGGTWTTAAYHAPTMAGPWREVGQQSGTGAPPYAAAVPINVGAVASQGLIAHGGRHYGASIAIDGTLAAAPDWSTATPGDTSTTDPQGNEWVLSGGAQWTDWYPRWVGEISSWPARWDLSEADVWVPISAAGILRRLGQGARPLASTLRRKIPTYGPSLLAYWPMEDGQDATEAASALPDGPAMATSGLRFAANSGLPSSAPLPTVADGTRITAPLPALPSGSAGWRFELIYYLDTLPTTETLLVALDMAGGGVARMTLSISTAQLVARWYDADGGVIATSGTTQPDILAWWRWGWCRLFLTAIPDGSAATWEMYSTPVGEVAYWGLRSSRPFYAAPRRINTVWPSSAAGLPIGHVTYTNTPSGQPYGAGVGGPLDGWRGETATARIRRLAQEEALPIVAAGGITPEYTRMGPQRIATVLDLLRQCAEADGGELGETRDHLGLAYRPRFSLLNRAPALTLDYAAGHIAPPLEPQDDDQTVRNDITVTRTQGSSARAVLESGPLSVHAPPDGIGVYDETVDVNVAGDGQLADMAAWRLHLATVDEMRYPVVRLNLRNQRMQQFVQAYLDRLDVGARITIANPPEWLPPEPIDLIVQSYTEHLGQYAWGVELTCTPASPWTVGEVAGDDPAGGAAPTHVDTDGSVLAADVDATSGQLIVQTLDGPTWVTTAGPAPTAAAGDLPVDLAVGGEVVTLESCEPFVWDDFARTEASGWGSLPCTTPVSWVLSGGAPADRSVAGGQGLVALTTVNGLRFQFVDGWVYTSCEVLVSISPSAVAAGAPILAGLALRISGSEWYWPRLLLTPAGTVGIEIARGVTPISPLALTGYTYTGGTAVWLRARVAGDTIQARAWPATSREPAHWHAVATDPAPIESGYIGTVAMTSAGNTNSGLTVAHRGFELASPQLMTVDRSVNGVAKRHSGGADIRLAHPMIVAL